MNRNFFMLLVAMFFIAQHSLFAYFTKIHPITEKKEFVKTIVWIESRGINFLKDSKSNSYGLMQVEKNTAKWIWTQFKPKQMNLEDMLYKVLFYLTPIKLVKYILYVPRINIRTGQVVFSYLLYLHKNDLKEALISYNAGQNALPERRAFSEKKYYGEFLKVSKRYNFYID